MVVGFSVLKHRCSAFTEAKASSTCLRAWAEGSKVLPQYLQVFFTPFCSPLHTTPLVLLLLEQNRRKHQAHRVGAEYQPQLWIRVWLMGWRGTPVTLSVRKQSWENDWVNEAHTNNQCVSTGPDLTNKFER